MHCNKSKIWLIGVLFLLAAVQLSAQVNTVQFGRNRLQYKKFSYRFFESANFNTYVTAGGNELGKFAAQLAEEELPKLEKAVEYSLLKKANLIVYNNYNDFKQSNIGNGIDWQTPGGLTKLVNNKLVVYFDGNHNHLRVQIREGITRVLVENLLFGDDIGEIAGNQALLDLPKWLTDGYIQYIAEPWNTELDDALRNIILNNTYSNFYQFAYSKPQLAGRAFWQFIAEKYKPNNVTYFLFLARTYKSLNVAAERICKKKFKAVLAEFMEYEDDKYNADIRQRRNAPKGQLSVSEDVSSSDLYRFQVNPNPRNNNYAVVEFNKGIYTAKLVENFYETTILLKKGVLTRQGDVNPNYPILAWDPKGTNLLTIYAQKNKIKMFVYDVVGRYKRNEQEISGFDQILDANYMLDNNTIILSAVRNGHSDIYIYKIEEQQATQITNDVYDDLQPTFVTFPNRYGIIFSSNRPGNNAPNSDTVLPSRNRFNIFMVDILNNTPTKQITQLTNVKMGNATFPMQYNQNHFTFVSDENGIANRWAGFFSTQRNGLDTLYFVGEELLRNPTAKYLDSTLSAWQKDEPDSIRYFQVYSDSTYTFPITNYESSLLETRVAGNNGQLSEVRLDGDYKNLYKLRINEDVLNKRNVNARPTAYAKWLAASQKSEQGNAVEYGKSNKTSKNKETNLFQNDFADEPLDTGSAKFVALPPTTKRAKMFPYRYHFSADYFQSGLNNNVLITRYQPFTGGYGPVFLNNATDLNWSSVLGTSDLFEDIKFTGGFRFAQNLSDKDVFVSFNNYKRMIDWGFTYYRSNRKNVQGLFEGTVNGDDLQYFANSLYTNIYQINASVPINEIKSLRGSLAVRTDRGVIKSVIENSLIMPLPALNKYPDTNTQTIISRFEFVHDNSLNPEQNIWHGLRYKVYLDVNFSLQSATKGANTFNFGFDVRRYIPIYRNFIWAGRAAADISWGKKKILYYLGGVDGWIWPSFNNTNQPAADQSYAFQSLAVNMRGYQQNVANGNNAFVFNSEFRLPVFSTLFNMPINNAFIRNFQLVQFVDLGTAWNGKYNGIQRPSQTYVNQFSTIKIDAGGLGPFAGGYGFGMRSSLLGYFVKADLAWPMKGLFRGNSVFYLSLGLDF